MQMAGAPWAALLCGTIAGHRVLTIHRGSVCLCPCLPLQWRPVIVPLAAKCSRSPISDEFNLKLNFSSRLVHQFIILFSNVNLAVGWQSEAVCRVLFRAVRILH